MQFSTATLAFIALALSEHASPTPNSKAGDTDPRKLPFSKGGLVEHEFLTSGRNISWECKHNYRYLSSDYAIGGLDWGVDETLKKKCSKAGKVSKWRYYENTFGGHTNFVAQVPLPLPLLLLLLHYTRSILLIHSISTASQFSARANWKRGFPKC